jgi:gliding motility-associated-like protein
MRIFNRWGEMVFQRANFAANDPSMGWDGTYKGRKADIDAYVYVIELICENSVVIPYRGNVTLIR